MRTGLLIRGLVVAAAVGAALAPSVEAATYTDSRFVERTVARGLTQPVGMAWAPDGRLFVVEKAGVVKTLPPGAPEGSAPTTVLDLSDRVNSYSDRGLLGVAVDRQFSSHPYLYLSYTAEPNPFAKDSDAPASSRLVRVALTPDGRLQNPVSPERILLGSQGNGGACPAPSNASDCIPSDAHSHSIGTVRSDPDGTLWMGSGDGAPDNGRNDLAYRALDEQSMAGKVLRIDRDGRGLAEHSFCPSDTDLSHVCTKVYAKGLRNPFRFSLRPGGGLFIADVGWSRFEEVNLPDRGGHSLGWPCWEGSQRTPQYSETTTCAAEYPRPHRPPDHSYAHDATLGGAIVGGPEYAGSAYPDSYRGALFYADYAQRFLRYLERDGSGRLVEKSFGTDWFGTDLGLTPGGELAYVDINDFSPGTGTIKRIAFRAPVARAAATPTSGTSPLPVTFDGSASSAPDGGSLTYRWNFGDGTPESPEPKPEHTYQRSGTFTARLTVTAPGGATASDTVTISAGNTPPRPEILSPTTAEPPYRGGQTIALRGRAPDDPDGQLSGPSLQWAIKTIHREHVHAVSASGTDTSYRVPGDHDADSHLEITLTATDSGGLSASRTVRLDPQTVALRLRSSPSGVLVSYAGSSLRTPFDGRTAVGFRTTVSAPATFTLGGRSYTFSSWSDGGARLHDLTVPDRDLLLEARYRQDVSAPVPSVSGGAAQPVGPAPGAAVSVDRRGPAVAFGRGGFGSRRGVLSGRAEDPSGVARVKLALVRRVGRRCRFWSVRRRGLGSPVSCRRPQLMRARLSRRGPGKVAWRLGLGRPMPVGVYRLGVAARDRRGNLARSFAGGRRSFRLRVR